MADGTGIADIKGCMAIHTFTHKHLALYHFSITGVSFVTVTSGTICFLSSILKLGCHNNLVTEIYQIRLFGPRGPGSVRILPGIEYGFLPGSCVIGTG